MRALEPIRIVSLMRETVVTSVVMLLHQMCVQSFWERVRSCADVGSEGMLSKTLW